MTMTMSAPPAPPPWQQQPPPKPWHRRHQGLTITLVILAALVGVGTVAGIAGSTSQTDDPAKGGEAMCDHFAENVHHGMSMDERTALVDELQGMRIPGDQSKIGRYLASHDALGYLERTVDSAAWEQGADLFAATCFDAGWDG